MSQNFDDSVWLSIEEKLQYYNYWHTTAGSNWNAIEFLSQLAQSDPTITKGPAISMLSNDLSKLESVFISNKTKSKKIKSIQDGLLNVEFVEAAGAQ